MPRPHFTLRSLLVAFVLLALPLSWVAYNANLVRQRLALRRLIYSGYRVSEPGTFGDGTSPVEVSWIRRKMGDWPAIAFCWSQDTDKDHAILDRIGRLFPEAKIIDREGRTVREPDKRLRQNGNWAAPHPRYIERAFSEQD